MTAKNAPENTTATIKGIEVTGGTIADDIRASLAPIAPTPISGQTADQDRADLAKMMGAVSYPRSGASVAPKAPKAASGPYAVGIPTPLFANGAWIVVRVTWFAATMWQAHTESLSSGHYQARAGALSDLKAQIERAAGTVSPSPLPAGFEWAQGLKQAQVIECLKIAGVLS